MIKNTTQNDPPEVIELFEAIAALLPPARGFYGVIVRNVGTKCATSKQFFSGVGAEKGGGRCSDIIE